MTRDELDIESALFSRSTRPTRWISVRGHDEFGVEVPADPARLTPAQREASDAVMAYWMERAAQRGREWRASKFYKPGFFGSDLPTAGERV